MKSTESVLILDTNDALISSPLDIKDYNSVKIMVVVDATYDGKLEFFGSDFSDQVPDVSQSVSDSNFYSPIACSDYDDRGIIAGTDGITYTGTGSVRAFMYELSSNGLAQLVLKTSGATSGQLKAYLRRYEI